MIGVIQVHSAPYRDYTFLECQKKAPWKWIVATFPDGMHTHPEWNYLSVKEDYIGDPPKVFNLFGRKMVYNPDIRKWLKEYHFDAILIEGYNSLTNIFAILYCIWKKIPIILGVDSVNNPGYKFLKKILYHIVSAFWVPGERSKNYLLSEGVDGRKIFLGKYTYDYREIYEIIKKTNKASVKNTYNITNDEIVILFVGKLIKSRNIGFLLDSFREIKKNIKLIVIGDGPEEGKVTRCQDDRIIYIPRVPLSNLYSFYAISDIYIHPGSEPYSLAVVQAVVADLIVISSKDVGAVDDVITHGENGLLIEKNCKEDLINAINYVLINFNRMKVNAQKRGNFIRNERSINFASNQLIDAVKYIKNK